MSIRSILDFARDAFGFLRERKRMWLLPLFLILLVVGAFLVFASGSIAAPFIYALF